MQAVNRLPSTPDTTMPIKNNTCQSNRESNMSNLTNDSAPSDL